MILAGGFVKYPMHWMVRLAEKITGRMSLAICSSGFIFGYAKFARFRYRHSPETLARSMNLSPAARNWTAAPRSIACIWLPDSIRVAVARQAKLPVFGFSGILDPIVPWPRCGAGSETIVRPCAITKSS